MYSLRLGGPPNWALLSELWIPQNQLVSKVVISQNLRVFENLPEMQLFSF